MGDAPQSAGQRIDKWLWFTRVIKSRTMAAELVADGKVRINRVRTEKPSQQVKPGDILTVGMGAHVRILEVVAAGERRGPAPEAQALYKDLTPQPAPRDPATAAPAERDAGAGRPTKRDRRATDKLQERD